MANGQLILASSLIVGLTNWFKENPYLINPDGKPIFKSFGGYQRHDTPQSEMPAVYSYLHYPSTKKNTWNELGVATIGMYFNLKKTRDDRSYDIYSTVELVRAQLLDTPGDFYIQTYLSNYVPGLMYINLKNEMDTSKVYRSNPGCTTIIISLDYKINIFLNQKLIWQNGYDYYSPNEKIYNQVEENLITVTTEGVN